MIAQTIIVVETEAPPLSIDSERVRLILWLRFFSSGDDRALAEVTEVAAAAVDVLVLKLVFRLLLAFFFLPDACVRSVLFVVG